MCWSLVGRHHLSIHHHLVSIIIVVSIIFCSIHHLLIVDTVLPLTTIHIPVINCTQPQAGLAAVVHVHAALLDTGHAAGSQPVLSTLLWCCDRWGAGRVAVGVLEAFEGSAAIDVKCINSTLAALAKEGLVDDAAALFQVGCIGRHDRYMIDIVVMFCMHCTALGSTSHTFVYRAWRKTCTSDQTCTPMHRC